MHTRQEKHGFTLLELVLVIAVIAMLAAITWPVMASARKSARVTSCGANMRQIGLAYQLYMDDYGRYPTPDRLTDDAAYVPDRRLLFCPEDTTVAAAGAASSYAYVYQTPPDWRVISEDPSVHPNVVLASCRHHLGQRTYFIDDDEPRKTAPAFPYHMVLRENGAVERIQLSRIRRFHLAGARPLFRPAYPGEPGYEEASPAPSEG